MKLENIDNGNEFNWGKTSSDYSKFRDIYPDSMYRKLFSRGIGLKGQKILDMGTGTGVFPRAMYKYGAEFTGIDISEEQIECAKKLREAQNMDIVFKACSAESTGLNSNEYDIITSVQSFIYFDKEKITPEIKRLLKKDGKVVIIWMAWLPDECKIAEETERLVLKYNPEWTGSGYKRSHNNFLNFLPEILETEEIINYTEALEFNYELWTGRIRACRGVSASLPEPVVNDFNRDHMKMVKEITDEPFRIMHEINIGIYKMKRY
ncbi:class I SAM-dependent methyltransferase [Brucepastera parasyntrophica]|uniref:class I SAM-dependent methyltransferase n=1 Tax=Brucepastera parasyntrophica TaxID=2880008 RepID=UPI00210D262C|nr:class I SAM-dependent methyltransferase [Brucepastera parasyntrophica]ULQ58894.1 class I SAM-dependent methyltransferase [Brucepastera parasyntrophica]